MKYIELFINTSNERKEEIENILYANEVYTFEEESIDIIEELEQHKENWDFVDEDVYKFNKDETIIKCYFSEKEEEIVEKICTEIGTKAKTKKNITEDKDWANNWKKYYHAFEVGEKIAIKPTWEEYENKSRVVINIDPGMAFGTGTHETTYLCLEAVEKYVEKNDVVFDIGCGTGILGIAAIKLGAKEVLAVDIDEKCIEASEENAKLNKVDNMKIYKGNLLDVIETSADIIVSNIIAEVISEMIPELKKHLKGKKIFIASGIIEEKINMVEEALLREGFKITEVIRKNGWAQLTGRVI